MTGGWSSQAPGVVRILVTNDDGVCTPGLAALARAVSGPGRDVVVVAPPDDRSGSSAAVGPLVLTDVVTADPVVVDGLDGIPAYTVEGPPALSVIAALLGSFGEPPQIVVSGINPGPNTGQAVIHSGTVGAALTAANFGARAMAVSLGGSGAANLATAQAVVRAGLPWLFEAPAGRVLNVNVPDLPLDRVAGVRWARLSRSGTAEAAVRDGGGGRLQVRVRWWTPEAGDDGDGGAGGEPDDDMALLARGFVTVTPLTGMREADDPSSAHALADALDRSG